jgi:hypothetical protein
MTCVTGGSAVHLVSNIDRVVGFWRAQHVEA